MEKIEQLRKIINASNNIVFFGGAGVSTDSGIKDFRGEDGLYKKKYEKPTEYYLSIDCLCNEPVEFYKFYKDNMNVLDAKPNITHKYLVKLENQGKLKAVITQNIDNLHQKAGSKNVIELHGTIYKNYCLDCHKEYPVSAVFDDEEVPRCSCGGIIRPDVVLYGEMLKESFTVAKQYISNYDTLIVAGTSLTVEPASSLVRSFCGNNLIIINRESTPYDYAATLVINDRLKNVINGLN